MMADDMSRRDVLTGIAGGLASGAAINWALPTATSSPLQEESGTGSPPPSTAPIREEDTPYAVYQYAPSVGDFRRTLPINVVFPLDHASFDDIVDVFEALQWYSRPAENARYAYDRRTASWSRSDWSGAEALFGIAPRLHIRCWELDGTVSIQAHTDTPPSPHHRVRSFADAARATAELFARASWDVDPADPETIDLGNRQSPDHDGQVIVIRR